MHSFIYQRPSTDQRTRRKRVHARFVSGGYYGKVASDRNGRRDRVGIRLEKCRTKKRAVRFVRNGARGREEACREGSGRPSRYRVALVGGLDPEVGHARLSHLPGRRPQIQIVAAAPGSTRHNAGTISREMESAIRLSHTSNYAAKRSELAKKIGLGQLRKKTVPAPLPPASVSKRKAARPRKATA